MVELASPSSQARPTLVRFIWVAGREEDKGTMSVSEVTDHLLEESVPWEVNLLREYCKSDADLDSVSDR